VVSFCGLGYLLDKWLGTDPWLLIAGIVLGSAAGLFEFIRLSSKTY
jgi:F0F1-type ATP synthase assembly protein I